MAGSIRYVFAALLAGLLAACGTPGSFVDATQEVYDFHANFDTADSESIFNNAAPQFQEDKDKAAFADFVSRAHARLGRVKTSLQVGYESEMTGGGQVIHVKMDTAFENGSGNESFTYLSRSDGLKLLDYSLESDLLPAS